MKNEELGMEKAEMDRDEAVSYLNDLTPRERQVLNLMAQHMSNREIARALGVGHETIKTHVSRILFKLGMSSRREAPDIVRRSGGGRTAAGPAFPAHKGF